MKTQEQTQTPLETVKARIAEIQRIKQEQIDAMTARLESATKQVNEAESAGIKAMAVLDMDALEDAEQAKNRAQTAVNLYRNRLDLIRQQNVVSEVDSDRTIDSLLNYEDLLAANLRKEIAGPVAALEAAMKKYWAEIQETERVMEIWTHDVRANYRTRGGTMFHDPTTGNMTDRSPKPVAVHDGGFIGVLEYRQIREFLDAVHTQRGLVVRNTN